MPSTDFEPKRLRARFVDPFIRDLPARTLDAVAHMLFELDRLDRVIDVGLGHLADALGAGRLDISFGTAGAKHFVPHAEVVRGGPWPSLLGLRLPNRHDVFQRVWRRSVPVAYDDVAASDELGDLKTPFLGSGAKAMLAQGLRYNGRVFAVVCADEMHERRRWSSKDKETMARFARTFLGPIVGLSRELMAPTEVCKPSPAELDAIRLAARGSSYKEIADSLGKSVRTVEFQLKSARRKVGAANQAELVRLCQAWI